MRDAALEQLLPAFSKETIWPRGIKFPFVSCLDWQQARFPVLLLAENNLDIFFAAITAVIIRDVTLCGLAASLKQP